MEYYENLKVEQVNLNDWLNSPETNVVRVEWIGDNDKNWLVTLNNLGVTGGSYARKQDAINKARTLATKAETRPAVLVIEYKRDSKLDADGKKAEARVSDWQTYS